jgi:hypothetical protein
MAVKCQAADAEHRRRRDCSDHRAGPQCPPAQPGDGRAERPRWRRALGDPGLRLRPASTVYDLSDSAGETIVTTTTTGDFPGGQLVSRWHLTFASDRIASLRIEV